MIFTQQEGKLPTSHKQAHFWRQANNGALVFVATNHGADTTADRAMICSKATRTTNFMSETSIVFSVPHRRSSFLDDENHV